MRRAMEGSSPSPTMTRTVGVEPDGATQTANEFPMSVPAVPSGTYTFNPCTVIVFGIGGCAVVPEEGTLSHTPSPNEGASLEELHPGATPRPKPVPTLTRAEGK